MTRSKLVTLGVLLLFYIGCDGPQPGDSARSNPRSESNDSRTQQSKKSNVSVKALFATNRNKCGAGDRGSEFGIQRADISYGQCTITVPLSHKVGELESPWLDYEFLKNEKKHILLKETVSLSRNHFFVFLKEKMKVADERTAFIFVHGFNNSFEDAARRTAQIHYDLKFRGVPVFYSWPSNAAEKDYISDFSHAIWAVNEFQAFLEDFLGSADIDHAYLFAHSMGNEVVVPAFNRLKPSLQDKVQEVLLAAADIDADVFERDFAKKMGKAKARTTLYVNPDDMALYLSGVARKAPRVGSAVRTWEGMETIDVTKVCKELSKHLYYAGNKSVISDVSSVLRGAPPSKRENLQPRTHKGTASNATYWEMDE